MEINRNDELVLNALVGMYHSMHFINLWDDTYKEYLLSPFLSKIYKGTVSAREMLTKCVRAFTVPEMLEEALVYIDFDTLPSRLEGKKMLSEDFVGVQSGWLRAEFLPLEYVDGKLKEVIFTTRIVNSEKLKEQMLLHMSNTDELTMLANKRAFQAFLDQYGDSKDLGDFTVISLDVNGLKLVNDTMGHHAGDELIRLSATAIREVLGKYGETFRTGGDEFIAIIHMESDKIATLKKEFNKYVSTLSGEYVDKISLSFGAACASKHQSMTMEQLWKTADVEMYKDKERYYRKMRLQRRVI